MAQCIDEPRNGGKRGMFVASRENEAVTSHDANDAQERGETSD